LPILVVRFVRHDDMIYRIKSGRFCKS